MRRFLKEEVTEAHLYSCFIGERAVHFRVSDIWEHVEDIKEKIIDISFFKDIINEIRTEGKEQDRIDNADLSYPIIISIYDGDKVNIIDGCHRLLKYQKLNIKKVKAVVTKTLPEPSHIEGGVVPVPGCSYRYKGKLIKDEPWKYE